MACLLVTSQGDVTRFKRVSAVFEFTLARIYLSFVYIPLDGIIRNDKDIDPMKKPYKVLIPHIATKENWPFIQNDNTIHSTHALHHTLLITRTTPLNPHPSTHENSPSQPAFQVTWLCKQHAQILTVLVLPLYWTHVSWFCAVAQWYSGRQHRWLWHDMRSRKCFQDQYDIRYSVLLLLKCIIFNYSSPSTHHSSENHPTFNLPNGLPAPSHSPLSSNPT